MARQCILKAKLSYIHKHLYQTKIFHIIEQRLVRVNKIKYVQLRHAICGTFCLYLKLCHKKIPFRPIGAQAEDNRPVLPRSSELTAPGRTKVCPYISPAVSGQTQDYQTQ